MLGAQDGGSGGLWAVLGTQTCSPAQAHEPTWGQAAPRVPELLFPASQQCLNTSPGRGSLK